MTLAKNFFCNNIFFLTLAAGAWIPAAWAGVPIDTDGHKGVIRDTSHPIRYSVDAGPLGKLPAEQALALVQLVTQEWVEYLPNTGLQFIFDHQTPEDVTGENFENYRSGIHGATENGAAEETEQVDMLFVFDNDGSIFEEELGHPDAAAGLADSEITFVGGAHINSSVILINGLFFDGDPPELAENFPDSSLEHLAKVVFHEVGHALGLEHTPLNYDILLEAPYDQFLSIMNPWGFGPEPAPNPDDLATLRWMHGIHLPTISGRVVTANGEPADMLFVTARNVLSPYCRAYGVVTGYPDMENPGSFEIPVLEAGDYVLHVSEYSPDVPIPGYAEFYNGKDLADEAQDSFTVLHVEDRVEGLEIVLSTSEPAEESKKWIDPEVFRENEDLFILPASDELCPISATFDIAGAIGFVDPDESAVENSPVEDESEPGSPVGSTDSSSGCSLTPARFSGMGNDALWLLLTAWGFLWGARRFRKPGSRECRFYIRRPL